MAIKKMNLETAAPPEKRVLKLEIECSGDAYDTLVNLLAGIQLAGNYGSSREWTVFFDGDGADHLNIKGLPKIDAKAMFDDALRHGSDIIVGPHSVRTVSMPYEAREMMTTRVHWPSDHPDVVKEEASEGLVKVERIGARECRVHAYGDRFTSGLYDPETGKYVMGVRMSFGTIDEAINHWKT